MWTRPALARMLRLAAQTAAAVQLPFGFTRESWLNIVLRDTMISTFMMWHSGRELYSKKWLTLDDVQRDQVIEAVGNAAARAEYPQIREIKKIKKLLKSPLQIDVAAASRVRQFQEKVSMSPVDY